MSSNWRLLVLYSYTLWCQFLINVNLLASNYGAVLDMVTDRCATAIMIGVIGSLYPDYQFWFFAAMMNDIGSHWFQMYS